MNLNEATKVLTTINKVFVNTCKIVSDIECKRGTFGALIAENDLLYIVLKTIVSGNDDKTDVESFTIEIEVYQKIKDYVDLVGAYEITQYNTKLAPSLVMGIGNLIGGVLGELSPCETFLKRVEHGDLSSVINEMANISDTTKH
jgi:hypothetical protein